MANARALAVQALFEVHEQGAYANIALAKALRHELDDVNRRFLTEIFYGTVKAGETLDWILSHYLSRPLSKVNPMVREILRLGIYQLRYLSKVPPSAVCNEAVKLTKRFAGKSASGFVNGVLRAIVRNPEKGALPTDKDLNAEALALVYCHPLWLVRRWLSRYGHEETRALLAFDNEEPPLSVRANTLRITAGDLEEKLMEEGCEITSSVWAKEGIRILRHPSLTSMISFQKGLWQAQDESSMLVAPVLAPKPGAFVIDACAAPGGKATHLAALMQNQGRVLALDVHAHKIRKLQENATRLGISILEAVQMDARQIGERFPAQADAVLVDAPCSGLGVLRRKPDARWRKQPADLQALPSLQSEILQSAAKAVKRGGTLVYSTCTLEPSENEEVVRAFLAQNPAFRLENAGRRLPLRQKKEPMVTLLPQHDDTDGFFLSCMRNVGV